MQSAAKHAMTGAGGDPLGLDFARGQQAALELIASGAPLEQVLDHIVLTIERHTPGMRGSVLTLPDGRHLRHGSAPNLPADYCAAIDGVEIGPNIGSCGTAMFEDRRVVVTDIATDPLWADFREITLPFGLRACWSTPLHASDGRVIGSFAMYYDEPRRPTAREIELADVASHLCGLAVENAAAAAQLRRRAAEQAAVAHISQRALSGGDLSALSHELVATVSSTLDGAPVALFARDEHGVEHLRAARGWPADLLDTTSVEMVTVDVPGPRAIWGTIAVLPGAAPAGHDGGFLFLRALANVLAAGIERSGAEDQIRHQALHDPLTGLPNRTLLIGLLEHALERERRAGGAVAVLLLDLDNFKLINDSHGHGAGDDVLAQLAPRMHAVVRESDTVGRFGGDEFVIVAEDVEDELGAVGLAERLLAQFDRPFDVDGRPYPLKASIGIALARAGVGTADGLLRDADAAMYLAKAQGGGHQIFDEAMRERTVARKRLVGALQDALDQTGFQLDYQRVVSLGDKQPVGGEALLRWPGAPRDAPGPANFVPAAEDSGLITPIGAWVLAAACGEAARWPNGTGDRWVAVNVSAQQLGEPGFAASVRQALADHGLAPGRLMLDVTESVLTDDVPGTRGALNELAELGVLLALDDVGTGFASLHRILRLPIHALKIDRALVAGLPGNSHARAVVAGVTAMAHELGKVVIAEGIETHEQLEAVVGFGCDFGQGYLFGRPGPGTELFDPVVGA